MNQRQRLGEILLALQVLTAGEIDCVVEAMRRRRDRRKFGEVARDMGLLREEHILAALAVQMEMFPGVRDLSMRGLLDRLEASTDIQLLTPARRRSPWSSRSP